MFPFARTGTGTEPRAASAPNVSGPSGLGQSAPGVRRGAERILAALVKSLQTMAGQTTTVEGLVAGVTIEPMRDIVISHRVEHVAATIVSEGLHCTMLALLDATLVHVIVELLAGGSGAEPLPDIPRAATSIDGQYAHTVVTLAAVAIETEWKANGFGQTRATRLEGSFAADVCGARVQQGGVVTLTIGLFGLRGNLKLVLPPAALDAFRDDAGDVEPTPLVVSDPQWGERFKRELGRAPVTVEAFLNIQDLSLGAIATLRPGQVLQIPSGDRCRASLVCDGRVLYRGELGQEQDRYALRLEEAVAEIAPRPSADVPARSRYSSNLTRIN